MTQPQIGSIGFVSGKGLLERLIEFFDKGSFSHTFVFLDNNKIIESQYFVNTRIIGNPYSESKLTIINLSLTEDQRQKLIKIAPTYLKDKYDFIQIIGLALHYIFHLRTNHTWNNPNELICSELVIDLLYQIKYLSDNEYEEMKDYTPNELFTYLYKREMKSA